MVEEKHEGGRNPPPGKIGLSFAVVLHSMYKSYTVIKMVLLDEKVCHV